MADLAKASLTIEFVSSTADGHSLSLEVNENDNNGKTSFSVGDTVYFRLFQIGDFDYNIGSTNGSINLNNSSLLADKEEDVTFEPGDKTKDLQSPIDTISNVYWYGNSLGSVTKTGFNSIVLGTQADSYGVANIKYKSPYKKYSLINGCNFIPPDIGKFVVLIYAYEVI